MCSVYVIKNCCTFSSEMEQDAMEVVCLFYKNLILEVVLGI